MNIFGGLFKIIYQFILDLEIMHSELVGSFKIWQALISFKTLWRSSSLWLKIVALVFLLHHSKHSFLQKCSKII